MGGRGWAWTAYDWDEGGSSTTSATRRTRIPIWNATPLVALDVYEHAYFLDYRTDRARTSTRSSRTWTGRRSTTGSRVRIPLK
jgi:superoxide dismutase